MFITQIFTQIDFGKHYISLRSCKRSDSLMDRNIWIIQNRLEDGTVNHSYKQAEHSNKLSLELFQTGVEDESRYPIFKQTEGNNISDFQSINQHWRNNLVHWVTGTVLTGIVVKSDNDYYNFMSHLLSFNTDGLNR